MSEVPLYSGALAVRCGHTVNVPEKIERQHENLRRTILWIAGEAAYGVGYGRQKGSFLGQRRTEYRTPDPPH